MVTKGGPWYKYMVPNASEDKIALFSSRSGGITPIGRKFYPDRGNIPIGVITSDRDVSRTDYELNKFILFQEDKKEKEIYLAQRS